LGETRPSAANACDCARRLGYLGLTLNLILAVLGTAALLALVGAIYQRAGRSSDGRRFPPLGRLIDIGGTSLHVYTIPEYRASEGSPPVVFEAGIAATSLSWQLVQPEIAKFTQTASYDRAELGWSGASLQPRTVWNVADELRTLMDRADIPKPLILVAHSYGALVAIAYALRHPSEVAGMVLVDPVATSEWGEPSESHLKTLRRGILLSRRGALLARLGVVRLALSLLVAGSQRLPKMIARASSGRGVAITDQIVGQVRKLPADLWPMIQSHWCDPKCFKGMANYLEALPQSAAEVAQELVRTDGLRDVPLTVLSAGNASPIQRAEHEALARRSSHGQIEVVVDSGHWIQVDRPDTVIRAIREMITKEAVS
jgi:pimeloyl-ACP methyl ester carboxylesterase